MIFHFNRSVEEHFVSLYIAILLVLFISFPKYDHRNVVAGSSPLPTESARTIPDPLESHTDARPS